MSQHFYVDFRDGYGERDYTFYLSEFSQLMKYEINRPALLDITLIPVGNLAQWKVPDRGALVRFEDTTMKSRTSGVRDGIIFTGFVTDIPTTKRLGGQELMAYTCKVTSEDYLANIHPTPPFTYVNKTRGYIIKDLLRHMFIGSVEFPYNMDNIRDGGDEQLFQTSPLSKFTDIVENFAKADNFVYYVLDGHWCYGPQEIFMDGSGDPKVHLQIDEQDPRWSPQDLDIKVMDSNVANDVTVIGADEAGTPVREHFISDGYQGFLPLAATPFGTIEASLIKDDFTGTAVDQALWYEKDDSGQDYLRVFEGTLNIIGGQGGPGEETISHDFIRSRRGISLSGIINFRDGEIAFAPESATGSGIVGGLYNSSDDDTMSEENLICGWKVWPAYAIIDCYGPNGREGANFVINTDGNFHYILYKTMAIDGVSRVQNGYYSFVDGYRHHYDPEPPITPTCLITWGITTVNFTDPANVITTWTTVLEKRYPLKDAFALYCPVASYDLHALLNYVEVFTPQQITVTVDGAAIKVGNFLDGGQCVVTSDNITPILNFYSTKSAAQAGSAGDVTIPHKGAIIELRYWKKEPSIARVINTASIALEQGRFRDNGVRQLTLNAGEIKPIPKTSSECLALGQAYLVDRSVSRYTGSYTVVIGEGCPTELNYWILPGDVIPVHQEMPDGSTLDCRLLVTGVTVVNAGKGAYQIQLTFGDLERVAEAIRSMVLKRRTTLDDAVYQTLLQVHTDTLELPTLPPDPVNWSVWWTDMYNFYLRMAPVDSLTLAAGVVGHDIRKTDTGWGQPNYVARFIGTTDYVFTRKKRDETYYVRPFNALGQYSRHSALVRVVHPMPNTILLDKTTGFQADGFVTANVPVPINPDWGGVILWQDKITIIEAVTPTTLPAVTMVTLYNEINYGGWSKAYTGDTPWVGQAGNPWWQVSSVRLPAGYSVTLYSEQNYLGTSVTLTADNPNLGTINFRDMSSSVKVHVGTATPTPVIYGPPVRTLIYWGDGVQGQDIGTNQDMQVIVENSSISIAWKDLNAVTTVTHGTDGVDVSVVTQPTPAAIRVMAYDTTFARGPAWDMTVNKNAYLFLHGIAATNIDPNYYIQVDLTKNWESAAHYAQGIQIVNWNGTITYFKGGTDGIHEEAAHVFHDVTGNVITVAIPYSVIHNDPSKHPYVQVLAYDPIPGGGDTGPYLPVLIDITKAWPVTGIPPLDPVTVVTVYQDPNYNGLSREITADTYWIGTDWNDRISSVRMPAGYSVILYEAIDYNVPSSYFPGPSGGGSWATITLTEDCADLSTLTKSTGGTWNDCVSSLKIVH